MKKNILVVDDEVEILDLLSDTLGEYGYNITCVDSGFKAIEMIKRRFYEVVLLDIMMPGIDGIETFKEIKRISPLTTVIMITSLDLEEAVKQTLLKEGAVAVLYKPFKIKKIIDIVEKTYKRLNICLIDKDLQSAANIKSEIEESNPDYNVVIFQNLLSAIDTIKTGKPDLIIIHAERFTKDEVFEVSQIRKVSPTIRIIIIAQYGIEDYLKLYPEEETYLCFYKPFEVKYLLTLIKNIEEKKKQTILSPKILLVEDDKSLAETLKTFLEEENYKVVIAESFDFAKQKIKEEYFSLAILDQKLPDGSGLDLVKYIKEVNPNTIVFVLTGYISEDVLLKAIKEHVDEFIEKPVDLKKLSLSIKKFLSRL